MARWLEIVLTLVLFAAAMSAVGWVVNATVPGAVDWLYGTIGIDATLAVLVAIVIAAAAYAWHAHRKVGTSPNGT